METPLFLMSVLRSEPQSEKLLMCVQDLPNATQEFPSQGLLPPNLLVLLCPIYSDAFLCFASEEINESAHDRISLVRIRCTHFASKMDNLGVCREIKSIMGLSPLQLGERLL